MNDSKKSLMWYNVALIGFASVWGFGNVVNNYSEQGISVIFSWIFIMFLFFLPYVLMVAEMGSIFADSKSGVSSWIRETSNAKWAYFAAWTYWIVHVPYIAQKPQSGLIALFWGVTLDPKYIDNFSTVTLQTIYIIIFLGFTVLAYFGIKSLKVLGSVAGMLMFIMSMLYTLLGISAIIFLDVDFATTDLSWSALIPNINFSYLTTLSLLVLAVGGIEKISPYARETKDGAKNFPKAMIAILIMVVVSAIFGSIAMAAMFDSGNIPDDLLMNGSYYAFQQLGQWYFGDGVLSSLFVRIYAFTNMISQFTALLISIDAPIKMLTLERNTQYVPEGLTKVNKYGAPYRGYILMAVLVVIIQILPMLSSGDSFQVVTWLTKLNGIVMPMRYLWVFVAYFLLKKAMATKDLKPEYIFIKNKTTGQAIAVWCFLFVTVSCIFGMVPTATEEGMSIVERISASPNVFLVNLATPIVFVILGFILPIFAKKNSEYKVG